MPLLVLSAIGWSTAFPLQESAETSGAKSLRVLLVQVDTAHPKSHQRMFRASQRVQGLADLVVWPECSIGNYEQSLHDFSELSLVEQSSWKTALGELPAPEPIAPLLAGGDSWVRDSTTGFPKAEFVSAFLFDENRQLIGRHDKNILMPYGESIPGEELLPILRRTLGNDRVISRGNEIQPIGQVAGCSIGVVLCCEDMYSQLALALTNQKANMLISIANGSAFKSEIALRQHFRLSRGRSIETGKYFVRCASRGVSAVVAPNGNIVEELPILEDCAKMVHVPILDSSPSWYATLGRVPILFLGIAVSWIAYFGNWKSEKQQSESLP
ncbi:MAG: nitrilase-related carbon-nitrogen hydrolase [Planctomycetota bacterium]